MSDDRHVLVIGAGTAGTRVARTLAGAGWCAVRKAAGSHKAHGKVSAGSTAT